MLKPLSQEQHDKIMDTAIRAFANKGFAGANINIIAKDSGVSVGVLYRCYKNKESLFIECVKKCLLFLEKVFGELQSKGGTIQDMIENLVIQAQQVARKRPECFGLYKQIMVSELPGSLKYLVKMIEGRTAELYVSIARHAREDGLLSKDIDPAMFAFFFDNLVMMTHFSYSNEHYKERFKIYCGEDTIEPEKDTYVREQFMILVGSVLKLQPDEDNR